ncbi:hypothetical protein [Phytomonospora endophytica]|uniref:Uncharacterized protein n=1 Tax=Phytomonospora endophytica TaxID=714109 RepID=A0A841FJ96_9ACTN|nr:hypothetical protein [Phytomonospora endophytica]MBB6033908.1 hypothetical protein [Phytomonospora endophytica]
MDDAHEDEPAATTADTRSALLDRARRTSTPVRKTFVQAPSQRAVRRQDRRGPLAAFVKNRDLRALQAYLLIIGATSNGDGQDGWSTTHPLKVWARAFGASETAEPSSASSATTKILTRLSERKLITRARSGRERKIRITLLREDGTGHAYDRPDGNAAPDRFLQLPHKYWTAGWCDKLKLPGLAMLLVALAERPGFELPTEKMPQWYGWSADTAERGFTELLEHGILTKHRYRRTAALSPEGYSYVNSYRLLPPFAVTPGTEPAKIER